VRLRRCCGNLAGHGSPVGPERDGFTAGGGDQVCTDRCGVRARIWAGYRRQGLDIQGYGRRATWSIWTTRVLSRSCRRRGTARPADAADPATRNGTTPAAAAHQRTGRLRPRAQRHGLLLHARYLHRWHRPSLMSLRGRPVAVTGRDLLPARRYPAGLRASQTVRLVRTVRSSRADRARARASSSAMSPALSLSSRPCRARQRVTVA